MKILNRPMFRMGGPIKEGIMSGIKEPRRQGYAQPPGFVIQNDPNKMIVDKSLKNAEAFMKAGQVYDQDLNNQAFTLSAPNKVNQVSAFDKMKKNNQFGNQNPFKEPDNSLSRTEILKKAYTPPEENIFSYLGGLGENVYVDEKGVKRDRVTGKIVTDTDVSQVVTEPRGPAELGMTTRKAVEPDVELPGDTKPAAPNKKERVNTILESLGYDRAQKNALYDAMIKAGQRISRTGLGAENLVSDVIAETSQSYDKPEKLREAAELMDVQQQLKLDQIKAGKTNPMEEQVNFLMSNSGGGKSRTEALDIVLKNPRSGGEAFYTAYKEIKDPKKAVDRAVEWSVSRGEFEKPIGRINSKEYKTPEKFFKSKDWKGAGNYILKGTIFQIDAQGNATKIEQYYDSKGSSGFLGFGKEE
jgi:hypothetical protein